MKWGDGGANCVKRLQVFHFELVGEWKVRVEQQQQQEVKRKLQEVETNCVT